MRRGVKVFIGSAGSAVVVGLLLSAVYRAYGPGDLAVRAARLQRRWQPFYDPEIAGSIWLFIGRGLLLTLEAALVSIVLSLFFGILLALMRLARSKNLESPGGPAARLALSAPSATVVQSVRSLPLFMIVLFSFLGAPRLGLNLSPLVAGIFALTLYTSCVLAEIMRAGILSLDRGQFEAADALGLNYPQKLRFVVLPQALRRMVPSIVSQLVTLVKDTSLLNFITVIELSRRFHIISQGYFNPLESYFVAGLCYFAINFSLSNVARRLEVRPSRVGPAREAAVQGIGVEDQTLLATAAPPSR
jgi:His/Glu/Gln/Arg/opine family amino acid ABC transporter permease subunit